MRILGFDHHWPKLDKPIHTTFRVPRKDAPKGRDWKVGETVLEMVQPRASYASGRRETIGSALIMAKKRMCMGLVTDAEAIEDGFTSWDKMWSWFFRGHKGMTLSTTINKLTLKRITVEGSA